jgi:uncharacterized protein YaeQ
MQQKSAVKIFINLIRYQAKRIRKNCMDNKSVAIRDFFDRLAKLEAEKWMAKVHF